MSQEIERYSRGLVPNRPESVPDFVNTEFLKLERIIDALRAVIADHEARIAALEP